MAILNDLLVNGISRFIGGVIMPATNVTSSTTYYPVLATGTSTSLFVDTNKSGLSFTKVDGTTGAEGTATLTLGNTTASGTAGNATGQLRLLDYYGYAATIRPGESHSAAVQFYLPNWTGSVERLVSMPTPSTQVGGTSTPVYVDAKGHVTVCTSVMSHTHNLGITAGTSSDTSQITLSHGTKYVLSAGGSTYCFTMPSEGSGTGTVTGSGISGYLAKWTGTGAISHELTVGPMFGTNTSLFLRNDGQWAAPSGGGTITNVTKTFIGTCSTAAATAAKDVTCADFTEADLVPGTNIYVTFTNTNTTNTALTMSVNGTTAKAIKVISRAGAAPANISAVGYITKNIQYEFIYDGTNWVMQTFYDADSDSQAYNVREYYGWKRTISDCYQYMILLASSQDPTYNGANYLVPYSGGYTTSNYTKTITTHAFNPFGGIFWLNRSSANLDSSVADNTGHLTPNATLTSAYVYTMYTSTAGAIDIRYSMNINGSGTAGTTSLTAYAPIYIKAKYDFSTKSATLVPVSGSSSYLERSSITQSLPTTNPNTDSAFYIYIYLGVAYDKYRFTLPLDHPVYAWNSITGSMCPFNGEPFSGSGTFTVSDGAGSSDTWSYTKVGKQVTVSGTYTGSSTSVLSISELPFSVKYAKRIMYPFMLTSPMISWIYGIIHLTAGAKTIGTSGTSSNATGSWLQHVNGAAITFDYVTDD